MKPTIKRIFTLACLMCMLITSIHYFSNIHNEVSLASKNELIISEKKIINNEKEHSYEESLIYINEIQQDRDPEDEEVNLDRFYAVHGECIKLKKPIDSDIKNSNDIWQVLETRQRLQYFFLFGAIYDKRRRNIGGPSIRILVQVDNVGMPLTTYCQIWFDDGPVISKVSKTLGIRTRVPIGIFSYLITCNIPDSHKDKVPKQVSLVEHECDPASNLLNVTYNPLVKGEKRKYLAVCYKGLNLLKDQSLELIEWLEILKSYGAEKIVLYNLGLHENILKVLDHYTDMGFVEMLPLTLPGNQPNDGEGQHKYIFDKKFWEQRLNNEQMPRNDCFYRNMYKYKYIMLVDADEIIVPLMHSNYSSMIKYLEKESMAKGIGSWHFPSYYFYDVKQTKNTNIPRHLNMMNRIYHQRNVTTIKSIVSTDEVLTVANHESSHCLRSRGQCKTYNAATVGRTQHYRKTCPPNAGALCKRNEKELEKGRMQKLLDKGDIIENNSLWKISSKVSNEIRKQFKTFSLNIK